MRHWTRCRAAAAALLFTLTAVPGWRTADAATDPAKKVMARVNAETITAADVATATKDAPGFTEGQILERLIREALIGQEARRRKVDQTVEYQRAVRRWRQDKAIGLIGIDTLRRHVIKASGKQVDFATFFKTWQKVIDGLSDKEREVVEAEVSARLGALTGSVNALLDAELLNKYTVLVDLEPEKARKIIAANTSWGPITLDDLLAAEPKTIGHLTQSPKEVLRMWAQLAREIAGRNHLLQNADKAGLFDVPEVKEEEALARRFILRQTFLDGYFKERLTREILLAKVDEQIPGWSTTYTISVEEARLKNTTRLVADKIAQAWKDGQKIKTESLAISLAWPRYTPDQKLLLLDQPWGSSPPPMRDGDGFLIVLLSAVRPPGDSPSLSSLAESMLRDQLQRELVEKLSRGAKIAVQ